MHPVQKFLRSSRIPYSDFANFQAAAGICLRSRIAFVPCWLCPGNERCFWNGIIGNTGITNTSSTSKTFCTLSILSSVTEENLKAHSTCTNVVQNQEYHVKNVLIASISIGYTSHLNIDNGVFKKFEIRPTKQYFSKVSIEMKDQT